MKRKIFSKLLMVALVIAAVGSFVSCKDYDDDINNLQKQIDAKAAISELTALQSTLDSKIAAAQSAAAAAQATADAAATKTALADLKSALETAIADAKKAGTDAGTQAGQAITAANKAQETADAAAQAAKDADAAAKAALEAALKTIEETYETKAAAQEKADAAKEAIEAVKAIAEAAYTKAAAEELQSEVDELKSDLESLQTSLEASIDEKIAEKIKEVNNAVASVDAIWSAITSIELVSAWSNYFHDEFTLNMLHGEQVTSVFGDEAYKDADDLVKYVAGDSLKFNNRIIVRVNPANATLAKEDIHLINSKGESLDDLVNVTDVKDFTGLITRGDYATGLKQITFVRNDAAAATDAAFGEATQGKKVVKVGDPATGDALFAITVNNTKDAAADRFVSTTFDIAIAYGWYQPATDFDFTVKGDGDDAEPTSIALLRNRWSQDEKKTIGEDLTKEVPSDKWPAELVWQNIKGQTAAKAPAAEYTLPSWDKLGDKTANVNSGDSRYGDDFAFIEVEKGGHFTVSGLNTDKIDYYYVALDKDRAVESAPSEWEAWNSYSYEGLLEMTPSTDDKVITISSAAAEGDIIGFRVFAVNYDGTLADPDGRAFYVKVGEAGETENIEIAAEWTPRVKGDLNEPTWVDEVTVDWDTYSYLNDNAGSVANDTKFGVAVASPTTAQLIAAMVIDAKKAKPLYNTGLVSVTWPEDANLNGVIAAADLSGAIALDADGEVIDYAEYFADADAFSGYVTDALINGHPSVDVDDYIAVRANNKVFYQFLDKDKNALTTASKLSAIKYIAVGFENSQNWVDGASKVIKSFNIIDPDHHNNVINTASIDVTKKMPSISNDFNWKYTLGPVAGNLEVYVQAATDKDTPVEWVAAAPENAGARFSLKDFAVFKEGTTNDYELTVTGTTSAGTIKIINGTDATDSQYITFKKGTAAITAGTFKFDTEYTAKLTEGIDGIGLDEDFVRGDYANTISDFSSITFKNPVAAQTYAVKPYNYSVSGTVSGQINVTKSSTDYWLTWNDNAVTLHKWANADDNSTDRTKATVGNVDADAITLPNLISATNAVNFVGQADAISFTNANFQTGVYSQANYFVSVDGSGPNRKYRAKLISGTNTEFYTVEITQAGVLTFAKNNSGTNTYAPAQDHTATLKVWAVDYFGFGATWTNGAWVGNEDADPIIEMPIKIKVSE